LFVDDNAPGIIDCCFRKLEEILNCEMPQTMEDFKKNKTCSTQAQFSHYKRVTNTLIDAKEEDIFKMTGCRPKCNSEYHKIINRWNLYEPAPTHYTNTNIPI
jgi:hypothetical protein